MTYYGSKDLAAAFRNVRANTLTVAQDIPEEKYNFSAAPGSRTVAQTLVHIAGMAKFAELMHGANRVNTLAGLNFPSVIAEMMAEEAKPRTKAEIIELLKSSGDTLAALLEGMTEEILAEQVAMPQGQTPATKTRFEMVLGYKEHEMHHRGQLMLMERILGITPHLTRRMQENMAAAARR
jgi:uncharacterized damage-inducible protein DinB